MTFSVIQLMQGTENTYLTETAYTSGNADVLKRLQEQGLDKQAYCRACLIFFFFFLLFNKKPHLLIPVS